MTMEIGAVAVLRSVTAGTLAAEGSAAINSPATVVPAAVTPAAAAAESEPAILAEAVKTAARALEAHARSLQSSLEFSIDEATDRVVVIVRDVSTGNIVRQIPDKEALWLAAHLDQAGSALFCSEA